MSDNGDWRLQASFKFGNHLVNIRAVDWAEFAQLLSGIPSNAPEILLAAAALEKPAAPPEREPGDDYEPEPEPPVQVQFLPGTEVGPAVMPCEVKTGTSDKGAWTRYTVKVPGGIFASTFDKTLGQAALNLQGQNIYARVEKSGRMNQQGKPYYTLLEVRKG